VALIGTETDMQLALMEAVAVVAPDAAGLYVPKFMLVVETEQMHTVQPAASATPAGTTISTNAPRIAIFRLGGIVMSVRPRART
jgi:hypothetical protein